VIREFSEKDQNCFLPVSRSLIEYTRGNMEYVSYLPITSLLIWSQLPNFSSGEAWGNPDKMDVRILWAMQLIRWNFARKVIIHCGYELDGHADDSFHKKGMAIDFHFENTTPEELYGLYKELLMMQSGGIGVYPFWGPCAGFHIDLGLDRTWARNKAGIYIYDSDEIKDTIMSVC